MKTHRPWQPHMSGSPLFNPYAPTTERSPPLEHIDLTEEETSSEESADTTMDTAATAAEAPDSAAAPADTSSQTEHPLIRTAGPARQPGDPDPDAPPAVHH